MKKKHAFIIPLLSLGVLFSCNPNKSDGFTLDEVVVNLDSAYSTVKVGEKVDKKVIASVDAVYVKKNSDGEVVETKTDKDVKGYTVKTDFTKALDYTNINDGFSVDVEYKGTKGSNEITITPVFQKKAYEYTSSLTERNISTIINSGFGSKNVYAAYTTISTSGEEVIKIIDNTKFTVTGSVGDKGDIFATQVIDEKVVLLDGCTITVKA